MPGEGRREGPEQATLLPGDDSSGAQAPWSPLALCALVSSPEKWGDASLSHSAEAGEGKRGDPPKANRSLPSSPGGTDPAIQSRAYPCPPLSIAT